MIGRCIGTVTLCASAALGISAGSASAQTLRAALVSAPGTTTGGCNVTDPQARLMATGLFELVDIINLQVVTPTLAQLQAYDAVLVWTNGTMLDGTTVGNNLADYVDGGGGVVVAIFANNTATAGRFLGGRWQDTYEVLQDQSGTTTGHATLGTVLVPTHPIMNGVSTFDGGTSSYRATGTALTAGSTLIAQWSDGRVLIAAGANPRRVDLGFYPPSNTCSAGFWVNTTDGTRLMAQALAFVSGGAPCPADADGNGQIEPADVALFVNRWFSSITGGTLEGDFDHSGVVDPADVAAFVAAWFAALTTGC